MAEVDVVPLAAVPCVLVAAENDCFFDCDQCIRSTIKRLASIDIPLPGSAKRH